MTTVKAVDRAVQISPESKDFLVVLFTDLCRDLDQREPRAAEERWALDALLTALDQDTFPDDKKLHEYVANLADATDRGNEYERVDREHRALRELSAALSESDPARISSELLEQLSHPARREILRLLHRSEEPRSAGQMSGSFAKPYDARNLAYHARVLERGRLIRLVHERPVGGVAEKFLASNVSQHEWVLATLADTAGEDASVRK